MDDSNLKENVKTLMEIILDEQKIVTYISASKELCIHVNEAKFLLSKVVGDIKKTQPNVKLNINFIISGLSNNNNARTTVCSEADLEELRGSFKTILFEHIYSVNQGLPMLDRVALVMINKFEDFPLCTGLIKGNSCLKRTSDEIGTLKCNSQVNEQKPNLPLKETKPTIKDELENGHGDVKKLAKVRETKSEPNIKSEDPSPKKSSSTKTLDKKNGTKTASISGFFTKTNSAPSTKDTKNTNENVKQAVKKEIKIEKLDENIQVEDEKNEIKVSLTEKSKSNKSINHIKKNAKVDKKRKRVLHVSDSESDNEKTDPFADVMHVDHDSEDEIPPTPTTNTVKITSGIVNPKKRRKIVDKTYTDEDGYILTKKEEVYESCSENEEVHAKENLEKVENKVQIKTDISPKEKKSKNTKKKVSPPQKGKQPTMMNFFKKK